jgi:uncharacterized membrane protein YhfC
MNGLEIGQVSGMSIFGMVVSGLIAFLLPIILAVIIRKKTKAWVPAFFIGAGVFFVFAYILESIMHKIVFAATGDLISGDLIFYALYAGLAAGLFEEVGRFIAMKTVMKKHLRKENSLMLGAGHGAAEAILIVGITMVSNLIVSAMINSGNIYTTFASMNEAEKATAIGQISALWTTPGVDFFLSGVERICAICMHICLSYLVYRAAKSGKIMWLITSIFVHAVIDGIAVVLNGLYNIYITEAVVFVLTVALIVYTVIQYRNESETDY